MTLIFFCLTSTFSSYALHILGTRPSSHTPLTVNWGRRVNVYTFPPFSQIQKAICKLEEDLADGLFILPNWPTVACYPHMTWPIWVLKEKNTSADARRLCSPSSSMSAATGSMCTQAQPSQYIYIYIYISRHNFTHTHTKGGGGGGLIFLYGIMRDNLTWF